MRPGHSTRALRALALAIAVTVAARASAAELIAAGDVDGDGRSDVLVRDGATLCLQPGAALDGAPLWTVTLDLDAVVAPGGDLDGDGLADVLIGEPDVAPAGRVRILLGATPEVVLLGEHPGDRFGAVLAATDLDGDGISELAVGAPGRGETGWLGVFSGPVVEGAVADDALAAFERLGERVERVWDVDGDGYADLLVVDGDSAFVLHGGATSSAYDGAVYSASDVGPLGDVDADGRAELSFPRGTAPVDVGLGEVALPAGDLDGDFVADVLIRGPTAARAVSGAKTAAERRVLVAPLAPSATPLGDVNGDGFADLGWLDAAGEIVVWRGHATLFGRPVATWWAPADPTPAVGGDSVTLTTGAIPQISNAFIPESFFAGTTSARLYVGLPDADVDGVDSGGWGVLCGRPERRDADTGVLQALFPWPHRWSPPAGARAGASLVSGLFWVQALTLLGAPDSDLLDPVGLDVTPPDDSTLIPGLGAIATMETWPQIYSGRREGVRRGASLALVGDVDGDGLGDLVEVLPGAGDKNAPVGEARAYIAPSERPLLGGWVTPLDLEPTWSRVGELPGAPISLVASAGDLNADALADFALAQPEADRVTVYIHLTADGKASSFELLHPALGPGAHFGAAVIAAGDLDDDGHGDLAVAAPDSGSGSVLVYYGSPANLATDRTLTLPGALDGERFGATLAAPGDVDGDGFADLVIGAPDHDGGRGRVALYLGGPGGLDPEVAWELVGERPDAHLGLALASGLDWNDDGFGDLAVAERQGPGQIVVFVLAGNDAMRGHASRAYAGQTEVVRFLPVVPWAGVDNRDSIDIGVTPASPFSGAVDLVAEVWPTLGGEARVGTGRATAAPGATRVVTVRGLAPPTPYQLRARVVFPVADAPLQPHSRWLRGGAPGQPARVHFRTRANRLPTGRPDHYRATTRVLEVRPPGVLTNDLDLDRDPLSVTLDADVARGHLELLPDGGFTYEAEPADVGAVMFSYRVRDGHGVSEPVWVTIELRPCNPFTCADGVFAVDLKGRDGGLRSVRCVADYAVEPPRIRCDLDADGALSLPDNATCR